LPEENNQRQGKERGPKNKGGREKREGSPAHKELTEPRKRAVRISWEGRI